MSDIQSISQNNYILQAPPASSYMNLSGLEYDGDKISGYAGSAFKAGTDLEFEYDSADNISAINSSAISTTPSQALYAKSPLVAGVSGTSSFIGINSADLARQLGIDETVLWSGDSHTGTFSENISAFKMVRFHMRDDTCIIGVGTLYTDDIFNDGNYIIGCGTSVWQPGTAPVRVLSVSGNLTGFDSSSANYQWWAESNGGYANFKVQKVIGINRKEA